MQLTRNTCYDFWNDWISGDKNHMITSLTMPFQHPCGGCVPCSFRIHIAVSQVALVLMLFDGAEGLLLGGGPSYRHQSRWLVPPPGVVVPFNDKNNNKGRPSAHNANRADNDEWDSSTRSGPERSQMIDFVSKYLKRENEDSSSAEWVTTSKAAAVDEDYYTHLLAIPVDNCHELVLELESVQRAILYHCPILVHSCIAPAVTRLPLLYVRAPSGGRATSKLHKIVQQVIEAEINLPERNVNDSDEEKGVQRDDGTPDLTSENTAGIRPLVLAFEGLEIDGMGNQVLSTVAQSKNAGTKRLQRLVQAFRDRIGSQTDWSTSLPDDPHREGMDCFRPRIPFMRLPDDWEERLKSEYRKNIEEKGESEDALFFLTSDQGGNGISPILWGQWMDDKFGGEVRMREVAVYHRRDGVFLNNEQAFYLPSLSVKLPDGNEALSKMEAMYQEYQAERMNQAEEVLSNYDNASGPLKNTKPRRKSGDVVATKVRTRVDALHNRTDDESPISLTDAGSSQHSSDTDVSDDNEAYLDNKMLPPVHSESDPDSLDVWTRDRIRRTIESRASTKAERELSTTKEKPAVEENVIFKKYKDGTLTPERKREEAPKDRPPFPSRERCTGFWRVVSSPTGFAVEENSMTQSDNLILRVDGTTAGGPILDEETRQKASGGTWRFTGETAESARLRIRLVIPPAKERILVMEGKLQLISLSSEFAMASSTFSIPALEERASRPSAETEDLLFCNGDVWIEDASTGANQDPIGSFSIMKLDLPTNPTQYTITIPKPVRNQD